MTAGVTWLLFHAVPWLMHEGRKGLVKPRGESGRGSVGAGLHRGPVEGLDLGVLLGLSFLAQIVAWMFFTHLQSRFLLPTIVPMTIALGLATSAFIDWVAFRSTGSTRSPLLHRAAAIVVALVPLSLAGWSSLIFLSQRGGHPNEIMAAGGVEVFTGHILTYEFAQLTPAQRREELQQVGPTHDIRYLLKFVVDRNCQLVGPQTVGAT